jgi:hypothetical protein
MVGTAILLSGAGTGFAREETGKVLEDLVKHVDQKLGELEDRVNKQGEARQELREKLQVQSQKFYAETNQMAKSEAKAEVINALAELNHTDRQQVGDTLTTISAVVTDLGEIDKQLKEGSLSPEAIQQQQVRIRQVLLGAGPILKTVATSLNSPAARLRAKTSEQTLVLLFQTLGAPQAASAGVGSQVTQTLDVLNNVAAQLAIVNELLEMEKVSLQAAGHNQLAELVLVRMANSRLGNHQIANIATSLHTEIGSRMNDYGSIIGSTVINSVDGGKEVSDDAILEQIRNGKLPDTK